MPIHDLESAWCFMIVNDTLEGVVNDKNDPNLVTDLVNPDANTVSVDDTSSSLNHGVKSHALCTKG